MGDFNRPVTDRMRVDKAGGFGVDNDNGVWLTSMLKRFCIDNTYFKHKEFIYVH